MGAVTHIDTAGCGFCIVGRIVVAVQQVVDGCLGLGTMSALGESVQIGLVVAYGLTGVKYGIVILRITRRNGCGCVVGILRRLDVDTVISLLLLGFWGSRLGDNLHFFFNGLCGNSRCSGFGSCLCFFFCWSEGLDTFAGCCDVG